MRPVATLYYKKAWKKVWLRVIGPLYSLDCVLKPIPLGTILVASGEHGSNKGRRYRFIRFQRQIKTKHSGLIWIDEWIKRKDVFNPALAEQVTPEEKKLIKAEKAHLAVDNLRRFAPPTKIS